MNNIENAIRNAAHVEYRPDRSPMVSEGCIVVIVIEHEPKRSRWGTFKAHFRRRPATDYPGAREEAWQFVSNAMFTVGILIGIGLGICISGFF